MNIHSGTKSEFLNFLKRDHMSEFYYGTESLWHFGFEKDVHLHNGLKSGVFIDISVILGVYVSCY